MGGCDSQKCCRSLTRSTIRSLFISLNSLIILASVVLIVYNLIITFDATIAEYGTHVIAGSIGITPSMLETFLVISSLLIGFFSGIAAFGMESANYRDHWDDPIFKVCGISLMRMKMGIYCTITGCMGFGVAATAFAMQFEFLAISFESLLTSIVLGTCGDALGPLITPLQKEYGCCGIEFNNASTYIGFQPPCAGYLDNKPLQCGCNPMNETSCMSAEDAASQYGCMISEDEYIYDHGCLQIFTDTYLEGFGLLWGVAYAVSTLLVIAFILSCCVCFEPGEPVGHLIKAKDAVDKKEVDKQKQDLYKIIMTQQEIIRQYTGNNKVNDAFMME